MFLFSSEWGCMISAPLSLPLSFSTCLLPLKKSTGIFRWLLLQCSSLWEPLRFYLEVPPHRDSPEERIWGFPSSFPVGTGQRTQGAMLRGDCCLSYWTLAPEYPVIIEMQEKHWLFIKKNLLVHLFSRTFNLTGTWCITRGNKRVQREWKDFSGCRHSSGYLIYQGSIFT